MADPLLAVLCGAAGVVFTGLVGAVKYLATENKRLNSEAKADALAIGAARRRIEAQSGVTSEYPPADEEENSQVRNAIKVVNRRWIEKLPSETERDLKRYARDEDTPKEPLPRKRMPSRRD